MKALIIKQPWIDYILEGKKIWEIRGNRTHIRDKIELIQSGSGLVIGSCEIIDCKELTLERIGFLRLRAFISLTPLIVSP